MVPAARAADKVVARAVKVAAGAGRAAVVKAAPVAAPVVVPAAVKAVVVAAKARMIAHLNNLNPIERCVESTIFCDRGLHAQGSMSGVIVA